MIILDNFSKMNTIIQIENDSYQIIERKCDIRNGEGGFNDKGDLIGIYLEDEKLFFRYNDKSYEFKKDNIECTNNYLDNERCNFKVIIKGTIVCDIIYKPYINFLLSAFGEDDEEFDVIKHISNILKDEETISKFIKGINNINKYYLNVLN